MGTAEVVDLRGNPAEFDVVFSLAVRRVRHCRFALLWRISLQVLVQIAVNNNLRACFLELSDIPAVVLMVVCDDHPLHRFVGDGFYSGHEFVVELVAQVLRVAHDQSVVGDADGRVAAGTGNQEKTRLDLRNRLWCLLWRATSCLSLSLPSAPFGRFALPLSAASSSAFSLWSLPEKDAGRCNCQQHHQSNNK